MLGDRGAASQLISKHKCDQKLFAVRAAINGKGQHSRDHRRGHMPLGRVVPVMPIQYVDHHASCQGLSRRADRVPVKQHRLVPAETGGRVIADDTAQPGAMAACRNAQRVEQGKTHLFLDLR